MLRVDKSFCKKVIKMTILLGLVLEAVMVVINLFSIKEMLTYCGMAAVIIAYVCFMEYYLFIFGLRAGFIKYTDDAARYEKEQYKNIEKELEDRKIRVDNDDKND